MTLLSIPNKLLKAGLMSLCLLSPAALAVDSHSNGNNDAQFEQSQLSEAQLAQMLAPIALYPDSLLTHILIAATYPLEIVQARRWEQQNSSLSSSQKMQQAEQQDWDPSVTALVAFPTVLEKLNEDLDWTQELGEAFLQDEAIVLASVQALRQQADEADSFNDMDNMTVTRVEKQIIIEPAKPEVIYVPVYDPRVVYGHWRWHAYPPVYWHYPAYAYYRPHRPIYWGPSVYINFNYFFGAVHWSHHRVVVVNHRNTRYYRKPHKIAYSSGSQRWKHKPAHRRGVAYKAPKVSHRYDKKRYNKTKIVHSSVNKPSHMPANTKHSQHNRVNKALKDNKRHAVNNKSTYSKSNHKVNHNVQKNKSTNHYANNKAISKANNHNNQSRQYSQRASNSSSKARTTQNHVSSKQYSSRQHTSTNKSSSNRNMNNRNMTNRNVSTRNVSNRTTQHKSSTRSSAPKQKAR
ncbi:DUF3300 domain-containing protein [Shewanella sp. 10N.7]|uniref:DUF3300 domain-containing protein n=1 Tax=Shewanella sp. 10N.7 TaxID=2885093 RepID=UPI001E4D1D96|nr:DUF3300 domain-containing protein [Shewanella sp. 10N.7]MCC4834732.1 DUF3300 domain-containing protein [Shewanella sp. 10N.7]